MPKIEELLIFSNDKKSASKFFKVSEKTICRWMKIYKIYTPKKNYGKKLNEQKAIEIRNKYRSGKKIKDIAKEYNVTFSTISRIIHNINYKEIKPTSIVNVIYNI